MLNRTLTLTDLTLFGVASIMGSGGFNLIGEAVRSGGSMWPLALGTAATLVMGSAYVYAGAFERFKDNTSETDMIQSVFGPYAEGCSSILILAYNIVSIIVILVFCSKIILPNTAWSSQVSLTIALLMGMSGLSLLGIDPDKQIITLLTWFLIGILVLVAGLGAVGAFTLAAPIAPAPTHTGFMNSLWVFFFILVGFDVLMKFSEETKNQEDIPTSFYLSNGVSILLTMGAAAAIAIWLPDLTGAQESIAIEYLFSKFVGKWIIEPFKWVVILMLLLTTFVVFLATSRYLYGLGEKQETLTLLREVNAAKAPWVAILTMLGTGSVLALLNNTDLLVKITDLGFAAIASLVAGSVTVADWRDGKIGSAAISGATGVSFLGLIASAFL